VGDLRRLAKSNPGGSSKNLGDGCVEVVGLTLKLSGDSNTAELADFRFALKLLKSNSGGISNVVSDLLDEGSS
jgi:hypothetical protein